MKRLSIEQIDELKMLRMNGSTLTELVKTLSISKTTIWHHIKDLEVDKSTDEIINFWKGGSRKRKLIFIEKANILAKEILSSKNRDSAIIIAMIYWAEGNKKCCEFINSDGNMVRLYLSIIRSVFKLKNENIKATIRIVDGMDENICLNYWMNICSLNKESFIIRFNDGYSKSKTSHGMCRITIRKGHFILKTLHALRQQICQELIY